MRARLSLCKQDVSVTPVTYSEQTADSNKVGCTGAFTCQLAKTVFRAGKVITTVSTSKVTQVPTYLGEGVVDQSKPSYGAC